jgi:IS5 family transposase
MFKVLILQALYGLSDEQAEFQVMDRRTFGRFLGLGEGDRVPDATTIWRFREALVEAGAIERLFARFDAHLKRRGISPWVGRSSMRASSPPRASG